MLILFDTETTDLLKPEVASLESQPHIIEIAMLQVNEASYEIIDEYEALLDPGVPLDEEGHKRITGLTNADLAGKPTFLELYPEIAEFTMGARRIGAHNLAFDLGVLVVELRRIGKEFAFPYPPEQLCTVNATKHYTGHRLRLVDLYARVLGRPFKQQHRAMGDVRALLEVVAKLKL